MKRNISLIACFLWSLTVLAQKTNVQNIVTSVNDTSEKVTSIEVISPISDVDTEKHYAEIEQVPEFIGSIDSLRIFLAKNIRYPKKARKKNIQGRVILQFIIEKDGSLSDITVIRGLGFGCNEEALRVISEMPKWKPGKKDGKLVRVYYTLPITFKLND